MYLVGLTYRMKGIVIVDIAHAEPLDGFELILVLTDATQCNSQSIVEIGVCDGDVRAVCLK